MEFDVSPFEESHVPGGWREGALAPVHVWFALDKGTHTIVVLLMLLTCHPMHALARREPNGCPLGSRGSLCGQSQGKAAKMTHTFVLGTH